LVEGIGRKNSGVKEASRKFRAFYTRRMAPPISAKSGSQERHAPPLNPETKPNIQIIHPNLKETAAANSLLPSFVYFPSSSISLPLPLIPIHRENRKEIYIFK
jgi:hypothetical protein